ncbi:MAG: hypothetical protein DYG94_09875 [Leptolyngbya sp. PLA3]|nr:MAG: hypothetical protein EDM82_05020 [Cyanobacteria bacterium CYA]MCE7969038.1 hypothetical protein [Leptolyngbya sp. PL-A3]
MIRRGWTLRRGFSLIEAAIIVVMIGIAAPPAARMLVDAAGERSDRVLISCATTYAAAVIEQVMADVSAGGLDVLADEDAYLDAGGTGLWDRLAWVSEPFEARGLSADLSISDLVARDGEVSGDAEDNLFRVVIVTVNIPTGDGQVLELPVSVMLGEPNP